MATLMNQAQQARIMEVQGRAERSWIYGCTVHPDRTCIPQLLIPRDHDPTMYGWTWKNKEYGALMCPQCYPPVHTTIKALTRQLESDDILAKVLYDLEPVHRVDQPPYSWEELEDTGHGAFKSSARKRAAHICRFLRKAFAKENR